MSDDLDRKNPLSEDEKTLLAMGYRQELARRMSGFSNYAISLSIICILAGGITSFQVGFCSVGGASIGLGWPLVCLFSLVVALTMGQVASAFPTAGGLYHWASILGGTSWGWVTAWFNLVGLITVLAAINAGAYDFMVGAFHLTPGTHAWAWKMAGVAAITLTQALFNHKGIRVTTRLTDLSGYLILIFAVLLTLAMAGYAQHWDWSRLIHFANYSGLPADNPVFPRHTNTIWLFALGFLLPAYTITGFDASAHTSEETLDAARNVPRGIIRSVLVSGIFGWIMLCAIVLAIPDMDEAASKGGDVFYWIMQRVLPGPLSILLLSGIALTQYLCGLATVTSASRMMFAFARDGGLPGSKLLRHVSSNARTPSAAIWSVATIALLFMAFVPYTTIAAVGTVFLYISYVLPAAAGFLAHGRTWTQMGPWHLGRWYRPLAALAVLGCAGLIVIGMQPPNDQAIWVVGGVVLALVVTWFGFERKRFKGPPQVNSRAADKVVAQVS
jgi:amino acid transporter